MPSCLSVGTMKKQIKIFLLSLWGVIAFPIGYVHELADDKVIPMFTWLQYVLGFLMLIFHWGWFLPAVGLAKLIGVREELYELEIMVFSKTAFSWLLPIVVWYIIFNLLFLVVSRIRRRTPSPVEPTK